MRKEYDPAIWEEYVNPDGKKAYRKRDQSIGYRAHELRPQIAFLLDRCRDRKKYPTKAFIDSVIDFQNKSEEKAARYIKYIKLGECSYTDVFSEKAEEEFKKQQQQRLLQRDIDELRLEVVQLREAVKSLTNLIKV